MHGAAKPRLSRVKAGATLVTQGDASTDVYLVLDGVVRVDVDGEPMAEYGPGALLGERAFLEGGRRTCSLVAVTAAKFAAVPAESLDRGALSELAEGHRREDSTGLRVRLHFLGVRGSTPAHGAEFLRYGGFTSCVALSRGDEPPELILDAGTGIRRASALYPGAFAGSILLTHLHWDHVHGLPFFAAGDDVDAVVHVALPTPDSGDGAVESLRRGMSPPHFPIGPDELRGEWTFSALDEGEVEARGVHGHRPAHPAQGRAHLRLPRRGRRGHRSPTCPTTARPPWAPGPTAGASTTRRRWPWPSGADVLVHDASWSPRRSTARRSSATPPPSTPSRWRSAPGSAPRSSSTTSPDRTDAQLDEIAARFYATASWWSDESLVLER